MNVISIQSHVVYGRVGNRAAVFPLERLGYTVWPLNTTQFSCHKGFSECCGLTFSADHVTELVDSLIRLSVMQNCDAVLSGYIGNAATGSAIVKAVGAVKQSNPKALYFCDPVMGDFPEGLYVNEDLSAFMRSELIPAADIVSPNVFEAELISGLSIAGAADTTKAAIQAADSIHKLGPATVLITSFSAPPGSIGFFVSDGQSRCLVTAPVIQFASGPKGTGDLTSALFLAYYLQDKHARRAAEKTLSALYAVLEASARNGGTALAIVEAQDSIANPRARFFAEAITEC